LILILARFVPHLPFPGNGKGLLLLHGNGILILVSVVPGYFDVVGNLDAQLRCVALLHLASKVLKVCYLLAWLFASTVFAYPLLIVNACLGQHGCSAVNENT